MSKILDKDLELTEDEIKAMEDFSEGLHLIDSEGIGALYLAYVEYDQVGNVWNVYSDQGTLIKPYPTKRAALKKKYQLEWYAREKAKQGQQLPGEIVSIQDKVAPVNVKPDNSKTVDYVSGSGTRAPATNIHDPWTKSSGHITDPSPDHEKPLREVAKAMRQPRLLRPEPERSSAVPEMPKDKDMQKKEDLYKPEDISYNNVMDNMKQQVTDKKQSVTKDNVEGQQNVPQSGANSNPGPIQPVMESGKIKETVALFRDGEWDFTKDMNLKFVVNDKFKKSILDNFASNVRGQRIPIVDKHSTAQKAYGWLENIWETDYGIEAKPRYNPRGIAALEGEEFGYHSPQVDFDYYDPELKKSFGPTLIELTLTNGPRIKRSSSVLKGFSENNLEGGSTDMDPKKQAEKLLNDLITLFKAHPESLSKQDVVTLKEKVSALTGEEIIPSGIDPKAMKDEIATIIKEAMQNISPAKSMQKTEEEPVEDTEKVEETEDVAEDKTNSKEKVLVASEDAVYLQEMSNMKKVCDVLERRLALSEERLSKAEAEKVRLAEERQAEKINAFLDNLINDGKMKPVFAEDWMETFRDLSLLEKQAPTTLSLSEKTVNSNGILGRIQALLAEGSQSWEPNKEYGRAPKNTRVGLSEEELLTAEAEALAKKENIKLSEAITRLNKERKLSFIPKEGGGF